MGGEKDHFQDRKCKFYPYRDFFLVGWALFGSFSLFVFPNPGNLCLSILSTYQIFGDKVTRLL